MVNQKYSEVKTLDLFLGYAESEDPVEAELNKYLADGWELVALITDTKFNYQYQCAVTQNYAIVGRPRI